MSTDEICKLGKSENDAKFVRQEHDEAMRMQALAIGASIVHCSAEEWLAARSRVGAGLKVVWREGLMEHAKVGLPRSDRPRMVTR